MDKSMVNKDAVEKYIINNIRQDSEIASNSINDYMIDEWYDAKKSNPLFNKLFKDSLTIEQPIHFVMPFDKITNDYEEYNAAVTFVNRVTTFISHLSEKLKIKGIANYDKYSLSAFTRGLLNHEKYLDDDFYLYRVEDNATVKEVIIKKGIVITKAINKILAYINNSELTDEYETLLYDRSLLMQTLNIDRTLVLSIDPMDYITASDNDCGWSSCFSLIGEGECYSSVYSAMIDPHIMIAYVKSKHPFIYKNRGVEYTFSNKLWRAWVYTDNDILYVDKNYPFNSTAITNFIYSWLLKEGDDIFVKNTEADFNIGTDSRSFMYSDIKRTDEFYIKNNSLPKLRKFLPQNEEKKSIYSVYLGSTPRCLCCGEDIEDSNSFFCRDHKVYCYCYNCGEPIRDEDDAYWGGDDTYCEYCFNELYGECDCCHEIVPKEELTYDEENDECYCDYCRECKKEKRWID